MIIAQFFKKGENLIGFSVAGHAGYANSGEDIVCASVSSAVQLISNTITESFKINADVSILKDKIQLKLPCSDEIAHKLIEGFKLHLTLLSDEFKGTIKITTSEV